jgi:hypothetical protein
MPGADPLQTFDCWVKRMASALPTNTALQRVVQQHLQSVVYKPPEIEQEHARITLQIMYRALVEHSAAVDEDTRRSMAVWEEHRPIFRAMVQEPSFL